MLYANYVMSKSLLLNGPRIVMLRTHYNLTYENIMYIEGISRLVISVILNLTHTLHVFVSMLEKQYSSLTSHFYIQFLGPIKSFVVPIRCHKIIVNDLSEDPARPF